MSPAGDDRPPRRNGGSEGGGKPKKPQKPGGSGGSGDRQSGKQPDYNVYGRKGRAGGKQDPPQRKKPGGRREKPAVRGLPPPSEPARPGPQAEPRQHPHILRGGGMA